MLKLLIDKLEKKSLFSLFVLRKYGAKLGEVDRERTNRINNLNHCLRMMNVVERMVGDRLKDGFGNIGNESKLRKLLSSEQS